MSRAKKLILYLLSFQHIRRLSSVWLERRPLKSRVMGSNPIAAANFLINIIMQIEVKRSTDFWDSSGTSKKVVPEDVVELSEDLYLCDEKLGRGEYDGRTTEASRIVRLISGVRGSTELGWHFDSEYVTVCPINAEYAVFRGIRKSKIKKVDVTNDALLEILRET